MPGHSRLFRRRRLNLWKRREPQNGETQGNQCSDPKGGVGKRIRVCNLGAGFAMDGKKVLMLDVAHQADLTKMPGQRKPHDQGFDFVPGNRSLSAVDVSLVNVMSRETVLCQYVDSVKWDYDYVLLDCRPSLGMLVINALSASDYVLIPVQAD